MPEQQTDTAEKKIPTPENGKRRRHPIVRLLRWIGGGIIIVAVLLTLICTLMVWILTPPKLTPLVERVANSNMNATLKVKRVELTFWHTFPRLTVDIDSLTLTSHALDNLPDSIARRLPEDAARLVSLEKFHGGINPLLLPAGRVKLYDVVFTSPKINVVQATDTLTNLDIFPPSDSDSSETTLPAVDFDRFALKGATRLCYTSLPDSISGAVEIRNLDISGKNSPLYTLAVEGNLTLPQLEQFHLTDAPFGAQGEIEWSPAAPMRIALRPLTLSFDGMEMKIQTEADFAGEPTLMQFHAEVKDLPVEQLAGYTPAPYDSYTAPLKTTMKCTASVDLKEPWALTDTILPECALTVNIPPCDIEYQGLRFRDFTLDMDADIRGKNMDASTVNIKKFRVKGAAISIDLSARLTNLLKDPEVEGTFKGNIRIGSLPPKLLEALPAKVSGIINGEADMRLKASDLTRDRFHRMYARGQISLKDLIATSDTLGTLYLHAAELDFGSNTRYVNDNAQRVDSLLTLSVKIDTLSAINADMDLRLSNLRAGVGTLNSSSSADTTIINPFGGKINVGRLNFDSPADSLHLRLRDATISGSLRRYNSDARVPQMDLDIDVRRLTFGQALTKFSLSKAKVDLNVHMRPQRTTMPSDTAGMRQRTTPADSLTGGRQKQTATMTFGLDDTDKSLLRHWDFSGAITASSARVVTPTFPIRNRISNVDLTFNSDSVKLRNLKCTAGESDFLVNGTISNLRRALIGSRRNNTLKVSLSLVSDTINVNELTQTLLAGTTEADQTSGTSLWDDDDDTATFANENHTTAKADTTGALLIPLNIEATFRMMSRNIVYSDLVLHNFKGQLLVADGAMRLKELSAATDIGSIKVEGLYNAPDTADISFGLGMKVNRFHLDGLTSLMPAIDSLMPMISNFAGVVDADVAMTTDLTPQMDIDLPTLKAAITISGDSLVLLDPDTFRSLSKWLMFRDKQTNYIDHMNVEAVINNSGIELYPFMFDIDRYRLGVMGSNDLAMNLNYHISVLKSPMPFKFGINIKGTPDDMKIRLGGAKIKDNMVVERQSIADTTRINIAEQFDALFRRGVKNAVNGTRRRKGGALDSIAPVATKRPDSPTLLPDADTLTPADSLRMRQAGLL